MVSWSAYTLGLFDEIYDVFLERSMYFIGPFFIPQANWVYRPDNK